MLTVGKLRRRFEKFNRRYWDGSLVLPRIVIVPAGQQGVIVNGCSDWGGFIVDRDGPLIEIRAMTLQVDERLGNGTLLHEMIHQFIGTEHDHRSRQWNAEVRRISKLGALIEVL